MPQSKSMEMEVWNCIPLVIVMNGVDVAYASATKAEFTPTDSQEIFGHAIALTPDPDGLRPEITITGREVLRGGRSSVRSRGIILTGSDQFDGPVTWLIGAVASAFLQNPETDEIEFDEKTAKILEQELDGKPQRTKLIIGY